MTIIGKILTFLIFVFSLLFLGFAIIINNTNKDPRTKQSWYERVKQLEAGQKNYVDDLKAKQEELDFIRSQNVALAKEVADSKARFDLERTELNTKVSVAENNANNLSTKFQQSQVAIGIIQSDIEKKTKEVLDLSERLKQADIKYAALVQENTTNKNQKVAAQIESQTYRGKLDEAEKDLYRLGREMEDLREKQSQPQNAANAGKPQPPPVDVQGQVTGVTTESGLVSINKGSDHGLAKNHTLEVYRLSPKPEWVGRIRIIQVSDHEAVGMLVLPQNRKVTVLKGDLVGSSILSAGAAGR